MSPSSFAMSAASVEDMEGIGALESESRETEAAGERETEAAGVTEAAATADTAAEADESAAKLSRSFDACFFFFLAGEGVAGAPLAGLACCFGRFEVELWLRAVRGANVVSAGANSSASATELGLTTASVESIIDCPAIEPSGSSGIRAIFISNISYLREDTLVQYYTNRIGNSLNFENKIAGRHEY